MKKNVSIILLMFFICGGDIYSSGKLPKQSLSGRISPYTLQTDDTVIKLEFSNEGILLKQVSNNTEGWNWAGEGTHIKLLEQCRFGDVKHLLKWKLVCAKEKSDDQSRTVTMIFSDDSSKLKLNSIWTTHSGPGPVEHTIEIINGGEKTIEISYCPSLEALFKLPEKQVRHWWVEKGNGAPSNFGTHITRIAKGFVFKGVSKPNFEKRTHDPIPWQCLDAGDYGIYMGIESTGCVMQRAVLEYERSLSIVLGIDTIDGEFSAKILPKERYLFPTIFVGCYKGDIDDGCNRLHRWAERWLCPQSNDANLPLLVSNSWGSGTAVDEKLAKNMIDDCAALGIEMYHVDAGWYKTVGWWHPDPNKFPNGLKAVSNYAHSKGLKFGLWVAWTQGGDRRALAGGDDALSVFNPEMKGWFPQDMPADWTISDNGFTGQPVCLASENAKHWCLNDLKRIVREYKLDMLEHDQTMLLWKCQRANHGHTNSPGDISHQCCANYYQIHNELMREFPDLLLENCVHGGRQVDFGAAKHSHYTCASDSYNPLSLRRAFYDTSFPMPPRIIEGYIADHRGKTIENFRYCIRSAMLGWCTIMMDMSKWTNEQKATAKKQFEKYKKIIRPQIRNGNLYHVSDRPTSNGWDAFQYYTPLSGNGVVFVFRADSAHSNFKLKLKGLKPDSKYQISFEDGYGKAGLFTGKNLMTEGLEVTLPCMQSSELIYLEEKKQ